jgi:hypothetical protein
MDDASIAPGEHTSPTPSPPPRGQRRLGPPLLSWAALIGLAILVSPSHSRLALARHSQASHAHAASQGSPFFSATSFWNAPLPAHAALEPESSRLVNALDGTVASEVAGKFGPWISTTGFSTPIYTVPASQPTVRVTLENNNPALQSAFNAVPVPAGALPASGSDEQLTVWQPSTDRLWEFWRMHSVAGAWHAQWGGAIEHVSQSPGYYATTSWSGAQTSWGATATSLPLVGGLITLGDLEKGEIDHALALAVPVTQASVFRFPAQRTDGTSTAANAIPEGTRFRLDPSLNLSTLHLPRLTLMIAQAAQRFGIVVRDTSGVVDFYGQDPTPTGGNLFTALFEGDRPWQLLAQFPWSHLQALSSTVCTGQPCPAPAEEP